MDGERVKGAARRVAEFWRLGIFRGLCFVGDSPNSIRMVWRLEIRADGGDWAEQWAHREAAEISLTSIMPSISPCPSLSGCRPCFGIQQVVHKTRNSIARCGANARAESAKTSDGFHFVRHIFAASTKHRGRNCGSYLRRRQGLRRDPSVVSADSFPSQSLRASRMTCVFRETVEKVSSSGMRRLCSCDYLVSRIRSS